MHPRPALPHDDRARLRWRAAAELDAKHLRELVAPVAGGAALLLRGAVFLLISVDWVRACAVERGRSGEWESAVSAAVKKKQRRGIFVFFDRAHRFFDREREQRGQLARISSSQFVLEGKQGIATSRTIALDPARRTRREGGSSVQSSTSGKGRRRRRSSLPRRRRASSLSAAAASRLPGGEPGAGARGIARRTSLSLSLSCSSSLALEGTGEKWRKRGREKDL